MSTYTTDEWKERVTRSRPLTRMMRAEIGASAVRGANSQLATVRNSEVAFRFTWRMDALRVGSFMDHTAELLNAINQEVEESKVRLQELSNEVHAISGIVNPALAAQAEALRAARMTTVSEIQQSLNAMREIRKFFFESNYSEEMDRLERFVRLCREIKALKDEGTFDAICDASIRMAVKETA